MSGKPNKISLATLPTPLIPLKRTLRESEINIWVKRDDLTGSAESGNKIRKLEFLCADALQKNSDVLISCGGEQSNHCRAVAIVARRLGMDVHLVLRRTGEGPTGNWLLDIILGATFRWVTAKQYEHHDEIMEEEAQKLRQQGKNPYIIPEGGSNSLGVWGYFTAAEEIITQCRENNFIPDYVIVASGSGATYAGLWTGFGKLNVPTKIIGITAGPDIQQQKEHISKITSEFIQKYDFDIQHNPDEITLIDGFWGKGYGVMDEELTKFISQFAQNEGIILDPTYTGKAFKGAFEMIGQGKFNHAKNIVLVHTGGIYGLFPKGQYFRELYYSGARVK
ncbi:D-cysteine desulfhydrase family protein [bacterium]|nr:MAG: D-cysteine desulfhydrase family protein [bacterium]